MKLSSIGLIVLAVCEELAVCCDMSSTSTQLKGGKRCAFERLFPSFAESKTLPRMCDPHPLRQPTSSGKFRASTLRDPSLTMKHAEARWLQRTVLFNLCR